ncbi:MAG: sulfatase [Planctomycetota bacterium]
MRFTPAFLLLATLLPAQDAERRPPNIVFLFTDDHAPHAISAYGSKVNVTPNIDRLANEGMLFRNSFCGNSICGPSRATILTGLHSHANGFRQNGDKFDGDQTTFPKLLQAAGYTTAMLGKWHLTSNPTGFDYWEVLPGQGVYYNPDLIGPNGKRRVEGYCTDVVTDLALDWLESTKESGKPFLLMCQHKAPHRPWHPGPLELGMFEDATIPEPATLFDDHSSRGPAAAKHTMGVADHLLMAYDLQCPVDEKERLYGYWANTRKRMNDAQREAWDAAFAEENEEFLASQPTGEALVRWKYQRYMKNYLRCVAGVDRNIGRVLDWLDANGLRENTIVVYSSDQGFYLGDHGWYDKRWMYEESFQMPLIVRWPGHARPGSTNTSLVQNIDYGPTFLSAAGVDVPATMHGRSLVPLLEGSTPRDWRQSVYYHYYESNSEHTVPAHEGVRTSRYKLIHFYEEQNRYWELYDLEKDPEEMQNLADAPSAALVRAELEAELARLKRQYGVPGS